jgi:fructose-1,6-bisphosphatase/inositol monophosphatase family enzyme
VNDYLYFAEELALWAMDRISAGRPARVSTKTGPADFVTETDLAVEKEARERILARFPGHRIVGEEFGADGEGELVWYLDPVDGTTNLAHGLPWASFSLALSDPVGALAAVVADPWRGEIFSAARGHGARLNGVPIRCATSDSLAGALVLTEWAGHEPWPGQPEFLAALAREHCTVRVLGSSALTLASVAAGRASGAVLGAYATHDVLAGVLICREAGCLVRNRGGHDPVLPTTGDGGLLAASPGVAPALLDLFGS